MVVQAHGQHRRCRACRRIRASHGSVGTDGFMRSIETSAPRDCQHSVSKHWPPSHSTAGATPPLLQRHLCRAAIGLSHIGRVHQARQPRQPVAAPHGELANILGSLGTTLPMSHEGRQPLVQSRSRPRSRHGQADTHHQVWPQIAGTGQRRAVLRTWLRGGQRPFGARPAERVLRPPKPNKEPLKTVVLKSKSQEVHSKPAATYTAFGDDRLLQQAVVHAAG